MQEKYALVGLMPFRLRSTFCIQSAHLRQIWQSEVEKLQRICAASVRGVDALMHKCSMVHEGHAVLKALFVRDFAVAVKAAFRIVKQQPDRTGSKISMRRGR